MIRISHVKSRVNKSALIFTVLTLILLLPHSLEAQRRTLPENVPVEKDPDKRNRAQEIEAERARRDPQLIMAEVNEDFGRLYAIDEELKLAIKATAPDGYRKIANSSTEIRKRATRLKANLIFPPPPKDDKPPKKSEPGDEYNALLRAMDGVLDSFLRNPIFKDVGEIDPQLANRARNDLDDMIKLSDKLKKAAEKCGRTPACSSI